MISPTPPQWKNELLTWRRRKDDYFASGRGPVAPGFSGLSYYAPDPAWYMRLSVERIQGGAPVELATSSGTSQHYWPYGHATLPSGARLLLLARQGEEAAPERLFVPFRDATNGKATYGAGRYLDAPLEGEEVTLDFNRAYHPFCAYNGAWTCPLPPAENWLSEAIEAGEKLRPLTD